MLNNFPRFASQPPIASLLRSMPFGQLFSKRDLAPLNLAPLALAFLTATNISGLAQEAPQAPQTVPTLQTQWVQVPAGRFLMGSHVSAKQVLDDFREYQRDIDEIIDEHPQHPVEITKPFLMAKTEVTVGQFRAFFEATGFKTRAELDGKGGWGFDPVTKRCD